MLFPNGASGQNVMSTLSTRTAAKPAQRHWEIHLFRWQRHDPKRRWGGIRLTRCHSISAIRW